MKPKLDLSNVDGAERLRINGDQIKYFESKDVWFELEISEVTNPHADCGFIVYVSWIQGHGQGLRLFDIILEISKKIASTYHQTVQIFWETQGRPDSWKFLKTLESLRGIHFRLENSLFNSGCRGYAYYIKPNEQ